MDILLGLQPSLFKQASMCREPAAKWALATAERTCRGPGSCDVGLGDPPLWEGGTESRGSRAGGGPGCLPLWRRPSPLLVTGHS